jgi:hypothetical protein
MKPSPDPLRQSHSTAPHTPVSPVTVAPR